MRILLVEDDTRLAQSIISTLKQANYTADWIATGKSALHSLSVEQFALVVLDLGLPDIDGLQVLKLLRNQDNKIPVIILSARDETLDRVEGLDFGADDYLVKPFDSVELLARIRALLRRQHHRSQNRINYDDLSLNLDSQTTKWQDKLVNLTVAEFKLLQELLENQGKVLTRDHLMQTIYGWEESAESNVLEVHIYNLRRKISKSLITTVRGVGYLVAQKDD